MSMDIATIPDEELIEDRNASLADIEICRRALLSGVPTYGNGQSTQRRLDVNAVIVARLDAEMQRREQAAA